MTTCKLGLAFDNLMKITPNIRMIFKVTTQPDTFNDMRIAFGFPNHQAIRISEITK